MTTTLLRDNFQKVIQPFEVDAACACVFVFASCLTLLPSCYFKGQLPLSSWSYIDTFCKLAAPF